VQLPFEPLCFLDGEHGAMPVGIDRLAVDPLQWDEQDLPK
jgi:hypothetical protein